MNSPPAVVMGLSPTGLHVVRELGRAGVRVTGVCAGLQPGRWSRYLAECIVEEDAQRLLAALQARFPVPPGKAGRAVLIPTSDQDVEFVIAHAARLEPHFAFQASYADGLAARIMTKESFYQLCDAHGVDYPKLWRGLPHEIASLGPRIAYPCMIKPSRIHDIKGQMHGRKGWIVRHEQELQRVVREIPPDAGVLLLQEIVPGPESEITLYCAHVDEGGRPRQEFTARKLRQYPPGFGSASLVQSAAEDECRAVATRFLVAVGYRGIAAAEFKRDPATGALRMIEINVRPSLWFSVTAASGVQPVLAAYRELAGGQELPPERPQHDGVRWRYALKDAWSALFYRLRADFLLPKPRLDAVGPARMHAYAVWAADDPRPAATEWVQFIVKSARRFWRKAFGA